tara:strand:+ start:9282 stop:11072 length:1791 start_codon:yes stop_codon:yes gene_type:complete
MVKLNISELDFEAVKSQFKDYLRSQTQFKDYNFEGSNMSVLLDVLSYNTYQNNFYSNMAINEMFLDSAVLRNSVVSHAKELNYLPRSRRSAKAVVKVTITDTSSSGQTITIPQYSPFTSKFNGENFEFVTNEAYVAKKTAPNTFVAESVEIFEGQMLASFEREGFFVDEDGILRVTLSNENADTDSIAVFVDAEATEDENVFARKNDIFGVGPTDKVFYIEPYIDGRYTVYFGNNVFGFQPQEFEDIRVRYRITSGTEGNGAFLFSLQTTYGTAVVETLEIAANGSERESMESIRYFAPKSLQIQERAVTTSDYEILLKQNFPEIQAVAAYGGEDLEPPQFGKVAISVYLGQGQESLSTTLSNTYIQFLKERSPLAIEPIFVVSEFMYGCTTVNVNYNPKLTRKSSGDIDTLVRNAIKLYNDANLDNFNTTLRISKLASAIDATDIAVVSSSLSVMPYIEYSPNLNIELNPSFKFVAKLIKPYPFDESDGFKEYKPAIKSGVYSMNASNVYLQDDGRGNIQVIADDIANPKVVKPKVGSVNYETGEVNLVGFITDGYVGSGIKFMATTYNKDIKAPNGRIFAIKDSDVTINLVESK